MLDTVVLLCRCDGVSGDTALLASVHAIPLQQPAAPPRGGPGADRPGAGQRRVSHIPVWPLPAHTVAHAGARDCDACSPGCRLQIRWAPELLVRDMFRIHAPAWSSSRSPPPLLLRTVLCVRHRPSDHQRSRALHLISEKPLLRGRSAHHAGGLLSCKLHACRGAHPIESGLHGAHHGARQQAQRDGGQALGRGSRAGGLRGVGPVARERAAAAQRAGGHQPLGLRPALHAGDGLPGCQRGRPHARGQSSTPCSMHRDRLVALVHPSSMLGFLASAARVRTGGETLHRAAYQAGEAVLSAVFFRS